MIQTTNQEMKKSNWFAVHYFHHNDLDGIMSAGIMYEYVRKCFPQYKKHIFHEVDYSMILSFESIPENDMIIFTDYSFSNPKNWESFLSLITQDKHTIIWIDHHDSSVELLSTELENLRDNSNGKFDYVVDTIFSATKLSYIYACNKIEDNYTEGICNPIGIECPSIIEYVNDYDLWKFKLPNTETFQLGTSINTINPKTIYRDMINNRSISIFDHFDEIVHAKSDKLVNKFIKNGTPIKQYKDTQSKFIRKMSGFEFVIDDQINNVKWSCYAVNAHSNSKVAGEEYDTHDIVCVFYFRGDHFKYSFYSKHKDDGVDIRCDLYAKIIGNSRGGRSGGGHTNAAGFQHDHLILSKNCTLIIRRRIFSGEPTVLYMR